MHWEKYLRELGLEEGGLAPKVVCVKDKVLVWGNISWTMIQDLWSQQKGEIFFASVLGFFFFGLSVCLH